ncbi:MAG: FAD-dependent thymidylate synthase [Candidatus Lokiarchaeota archaeon]|nr:FAD-dependent thymidylate synthase [Candidatus Lokiarchaeota archaeon]
MVNIIDPYYEIWSLGAFQESVKILKFIEKIARVCYKSEDKISEDSYTRLLKMLIKNRHGAMLEHGGMMTIHFVCNRGFTHEIVRHRLASFAQESTRYVDYSKDKFENEITFVRPPNLKQNTPEYEKWYNAMVNAEEKYLNLRKAKVSTQIARGVLPIDVKTEIVVSTNHREWRNIFRLRTAPDAHPSMHQLMRPLLKELKQKIPIMYDDIEY